MERATCVGTSASSLLPSLLHLPLNYLTLMVAAGTLLSLKIFSAAAIWLAVSVSRWQGRMGMGRQRERAWALEDSCLLASHSKAACAPRLEQQASHRHLVERGGRVAVLERAIGAHRPPRVCPRHVDLCRAGDGMRELMHSSMHPQAAGGEPPLCSRPPAWPSREPRPDTTPSMYIVRTNLMANDAPADTPNMYLGLLASPLSRPGPRSQAWMSALALAWSPARGARGVSERC